MQKAEITSYLPPKFSPLLFGLRFAKRGNGTLIDPLNNPCLIVLSFQDSLKIIIRKKDFLNSEYHIFTLIKKTSQGLNILH